ncbi:MBL fold metallo-hydrolase [Sphingobacterium sp. PU5-4]|uniref:MBL fold metallo-hydrolase n=1 Tax=Sphingobacterium tenebrionis TaxID=3111775 RepID=A0ABU8I225_9SPHI
MVKIQRFENSPIDSVTYIISNPANLEAIIVDPGTENDERIVKYLNDNLLTLKYIFLTHEHFDHILGVNFMRSIFPKVQLISSQKTSERLPNSKKNLAIFHNYFNLVVNEADHIVSNGKIQMIDLDFEIFETPGHTDSSISLKFEKYFFSGDFLLKGTRIVTNLPSGSKKQYQESVEKYSDMLDELIIHPGHGDIYVFNK